MDAHEDTPRFQVLSVTDTGRRRRWSDDEKIRIVKESLGDGVALAEVARRHDISRSQLYDWRYRHKIGLLGAGPQFLRVLQVEDGSCPDDVPTPPAPVLTIELGFVPLSKTGAELLFELILQRYERGAPKFDSKSAK